MKQKGFSLFILFSVFLMCNSPKKKESVTQILPQEKQQSSNLLLVELNNGSKVNWNKIVDDIEKDTLFIEISKQSKNIEYLKKLVHSLTDAEELSDTICDKSLKKSYVSYFLLDALLKPEDCEFVRYDVYEQGCKYSPQLFDGLDGNSKMYIDLFTTCIEDKRYKVSE